MCNKDWLKCEGAIISFLSQERDSYKICFVDVKLKGKY